MGKLKPLEHKFKRFFTGAFSGLLKKGRRGFDRLDPYKIQRVLFLRPEKIGDMVISFPVFDALSANYPHIKMSLLGSPMNIAIIKDDPRFEKIFLYRKNLRDFATMRAIRRERYDCVLDMINGDSATSLFLSQLAAPGSPRIGIGKDRHAGYYDFNHVYSDGVGPHILIHTLQLLQPFGIDSDNVSHYSAPYVSPGDMKTVDEFLGPTKSGPLIGFNLSAGKPNRIWSDKRAAEACRKLLAMSGDFRVVVITTPSERDRGQRVLEGLGERAMLIPPGMSLKSVSGLISKLSLLVSPDTSLVHIGRSFRIPVVGLYSRAPHNIKRWQPYGQSDGAIMSTHEDDIYDITADQVVERIVQVLRREKLVAG